MTHKSLILLSSTTKNNTITPLKLLGFNNKRQLKRQLNYNLSEFLKSNLNAYPLNLILTEKTKAFSHPLNEMVLDIKSINGLNQIDDNIDPNDKPLLLDYKVIDYKNNNELHKTFLKDYECIKNMKGQNFIIISFTKDGLNSNTSFISSFKDKYQDYFRVKACIVSTQTYPFLRSLKNSKNDNITKNLSLLASLGLTNVHKFKDGSLVLTNDSLYFF
ncbi:hypothetical protein C6P40_000775 [Pichia californica]|uniref:Uncharacterized protein n=1 Tax=Pichia californica TaxID=460514 RepID=A0A9P7BGR3_9ASCO|nr:hypothetical protein C6P40_000775 [[Candida] californica]